MRNCVPDGVHRQDSAGTEPKFIKVARVNGCCLCLRKRDGRIFVRLFFPTLSIAALDMGYADRIEGVATMIGNLTEFHARNILAI